MIRTLLALLPADKHRSLALHTALTVISVIARAVGTVLLVPLVAALFSPIPSAAWPWVGLLALATIVGWILDWIAARIGYEIGFTLLETSQRRLADRLVRTDLGWFTPENVATARRSIAATGPELVGIMVYLVTPVLSALLLPIAIGLALLPISMPLGWVGLAGVPILWGAYLAAGRFGRAADAAAAEANSGLTERIVEFARTQQALRAARRVEPERSHVGAALDAQHGAITRLLTMQIPGQILFSLASQIVLLAMAGTAVWLAVTGAVSLPQSIALIVVVVRYLEPFTVLAELSGGVESAAGVLRTLRTVLDAPLVPEGSREWLADGAPGVELRGVGFAYGEDLPRVLDGLNLTLEPGSTTAIVGPSGSGKSTVLSLLAGLHPPVEGSIVVGGVDVATLDADSRRGLASVVFQQPYLFDGTIEENIRAGHTEADDDALASAARLAQVDSILERVPGGWDARVGEGGSMLSGGERQRVSIARALLKSAPLLLVDEGTSALDTENETAIAAALTAEAAPRTRVIVAHRLSSIRTADRVLFMDDGRIIEDGTVDELRMKGGRFSDFWRHQTEATTWRLGM